MCVHFYDYYVAKNLSRGRDRKTVIRLAKILFCCTNHKHMLFMICCCCSSYCFVPISSNFS